MTKITFCCAALLGAAVGMCVAPTTSAQSFPNKSISIVVPVPPGGPMDFAARVIGTELQARLKQTVLIENKPGAGALLGAQIVAQAPADGYTLLVHNTSIVAYQIFVKTKFRYEKDLVPVSTIMEAPYVFFSSAAMPRTLPEIVAAARAKPGSLNVAVIPNSLQQLRTMKFLALAKIDAKMIPYTGTTPVRRALLSNEAQLYMASPFGMEELVKEGKMHGVAVLAKEKYRGLPDVPTAPAQGLPFETSEVYAMHAPAGTPQAVIKKLADEIAVVLKKPEVVSKIGTIGNDARASSPQELGSELSAASTEAVALAKQAGIEPK